eukprot:scaffold119193_cov51-Phaeocystis_antarctica.AAC.3
MNRLLSERQALVLDRALLMLRRRQRPPALCAAAAAARAFSPPALIERASCPKVNLPTNS